MRLRWGAIIFLPRAPHCNEAPDAMHCLERGLILVEMNFA